MLLKILATCSKNIFKKKKSDGIENETPAIFRCIVQNDPAGRWTRLGLDVEGEKDIQISWFVSPSD